MYLLCCLQYLVHAPSRGSYHFDFSHQLISFHRLVLRNQIHVVNALTQESALLTVCAEETMREIQDRYMEYNKHAKSYTWKS